jgi:hypothetical protein
VDKLEAIPVSKTGDRLSRYMMNPGIILGGRFRGFMRYYFHYRIYLKDYKKEPAGNGVFRFIQFLKFRWGTRSNILFPFLFLKKLYLKFFHIIKKYRKKI